MTRHEASLSYLILKEESSKVVPVKVLHNPELAQAVLQPLRWKILGELSSGEQCARDLARKLGQSEQVISYHVKELQKLNFIHLERTVRKRGATAKYYKVEHRALAAILGDDKGSNNEGRSQKPLTEVCKKVLDPFIGKGYLEGFIVIGSPDPHGIFRARARCGHGAADIAFFLGSLLPLSRDAIVKLDTEILHSELAKNLILIGGPKVNTVSMTINEWLPITYELTTRNMMISKISGRTYEEDQEGAVQMIANPLNPEAKVLIVAGNSYLGTKAAIIAFMKYTEDVASGNVYNRNLVARVVRGVDMNGDGVMDDIHFLE
jgi:DNA-binding transcriptional ArsR family regulator